MPARPLLTVLSCLFCLLARPVGAADSGPSRWPLDLPTRYLTSGFMEHRPGRFHAGLDLKTRGETGFPVLAVADGSIVRVRATARAYGRAVYLQTADGTTYVYAHLSRFNDELRDRIARGRARSGLYRTELYFKPGEIPVHAGQVLGLSGQSGTSGPHLHFEVRDAAQRPLNPFAHGFAVPDTFAPVISSVHAIPMTPDARVGACNGIMAAGRAGGAALPDTLPVLAISGPVAFTAAVVDHVDERGYRLEPQQLTVQLDGRTVYRADNTAFAFAQGSRSRLEWYDGFGGRERWLHRRPADDVPGRRGEVWPLGRDGSGLAPGLHHLVIAARDHAGNLARTVLPLRVGDAIGSCPGWRPDSLQVAPGLPPGALDGVRLDPFFIAGLDTAAWTVQDLDPAQGDPVLTPVRIGMRPVRIPSVALIQALAQHLEPTATAAYVLAADLPLESTLQVRFPGNTDLPEAGECRRVFRWDGKVWRPVSEVLADVDGAPGFKLTTPGLHAVLIDARAPALSLPGSARGVLAVGPGPRREIPGVTLPRWDVFPVAVDEDGSGFDPAGVRVTLDGAPLVVEPDPPRSRLLVELPDTTAPGPHRLDVEVADACGNGAAAAWELVCRE